MLTQHAHWMFLKKVIVLWFLFFSFLSLGSSLFFFFPLFFNPIPLSTPRPHGVPALISQLMNVMEQQQPKCISNVTVLSGNRAQIKRTVKIQELALTGFLSLSLLLFCLISIIRKLISPISCFSQRCYHNRQKREPLSSRPRFLFQLWVFCSLFRYRSSLLLPLSVWETNHWL